MDLAYAGAPVPNEADLFLDWDEQTVAFADGETVMLRKPKLRVENLKFGALGDDTMMSLRMAQPLVGIGFLEAVAEESLLSIADKQRALNFNGRPNRVWDAVNKRTALGRFGWKANVPSLKQQIAAAALGDMGEGLADGRPDFKAGPRDWRTPALWGLGLSQTVSGSTAMLHDGRARNVIEAIFWHGGEAERAREAFRKMSKADREALVRFVETI